MPTLYAMSRTRGKRNKRSRRRRAKAKTRVDKRQDKAIQTLLNAKEKKYDMTYSNVSTPGVPTSVDMTNDTGTISTPPVFNDLTNQIVQISPTIQQGLTDRNRVGDQVKLSSMNFEAVASYQLDDAGKIKEGDIAHCRVLVMWDEDATYQGAPTTAGVPTIQDNPLSWNHILQIGKDSGVQSPLYSLDSLNNDLVIRGKRISKIADFKFDLVAGTSRSVKRFNFRKFWKATHLNYLLGSDRPIKRQLKLAFVSNRSAQECPSMMYRIRYTFSDS